MAFDMEGARRAGYTPAEIADHLAQSRQFDAAGARQAGYSDTDIIGHLTATPPNPERAAAREANSGVGGYIDGTMRQLAQGATFGLADEGVAAIRTGAGLWGDYGQALSQERARDDTFRQDNPGTAIAANIAGGVGGAMATRGMVGSLPVVQAGVGMGQRLAQAVAPSMAGFLTRLATGTGVGARTAQVGTAGAAGGAAGGFGEGEGDGRVSSALQGAALGGVGGAAIGGGVRAAAPYVGRVLDGFGLRNATTAADRQILRALERDGVSVDELAGRIDTPNPTALVDAAGRDTVNGGAVAANTPGGGMEAADRFVTARRAARPERIAAEVDTAFGGGGGTQVMDEVAALQAQRSGAAAPLYESAFSRIRPDEAAAARLIPAVDDPIGQEALQKGLRVIELENTAARLRDPTTPVFDPATYGVARGEDGQFVLTDGFRNMRLYDAVKRGYDEIVEGFRDPTSGRLNLNQYGRAVNDARAAYVGILRDFYPRYGSALNAWAGPSQSLDAMAQGQRFLGLNPDVATRIVEGTTPSNMDFLRLGVGRAVTDATRKPATAVGAANNLLEDRNIQRTLAATLPPERLAGLNSGLSREVQYGATERAVSPRAGSQTGRLAAGSEDMATDPAGGMLTALMQGRGYTAAALQGARSLYRRTQGINSSTSDALASRLFNTDTAANQAAVQALVDRVARDTLSQQQKATLVAAMLRGTGGAAGQLLANPN